MAEKIICGIDIGSSKITTIVGVDLDETEQLKVIGHDTTSSRGVKKGLIVDIQEVIQAIDQSVERAERMAGHKISSAFVSVGGPHISSLNSHGIVAVSQPQEEIREEDVKRVIEAARAISLSNNREIIEVAPRDFIVDGQAGIKNPIGMSGVRLEVETHIITASVTNLKNIDRCLDELGITNLGYVFSGLSSAHSVLTDTEKQLGVALVDIGGGKTDLCVYVEGALAYSSSIPVGAQHITNDIAVGLRISLNAAEKVKLSLKTSKSHAENKKIDLKKLNLSDEPEEISKQKLFDEIIQPRLEEIYKLIFDELEKSGFSTQIPSGLVITGGGALSYGMIKMGKKTLGLPIRLGTPKNITGLIDEILDPKFATIVGLLIYAKQAETKQPGFKNFNKIFQDLSLNNSLSSLKEFFKQFIP